MTFWARTSRVPRTSLLSSESILPMGRVAAWTAEQQDSSFSRRAERTSDFKRASLWDPQTPARRPRHWVLFAGGLSIFLVFALVMRPSITTTRPHKEEQELSNRPTFDTSEGTNDDYIRLYSKMTHDGKYFPMDFGDYGSYNPNLIPHPQKKDTWFMIAQALQTPGGVGGGLIYSQELVCEAIYRNGTMQCIRSPLSLPVASTTSEHCTENLEWFNLFIGPNDPRVFLGPDRPYITYGSASQYTCLGQWIHDFRRLTNYFAGDLPSSTDRFFQPTELQRPPPLGSIEKNWFAFWDSEGNMYLHYDLLPERSFARISSDGGSISENLAPAAAEHDKQCMAKFMPKLLPKEHIHQATNSLAITMCSRYDLSCHGPENTYIMTIFHHKMYHGHHNLYEQYILLFKSVAPFELYAIAKKPLWINGRGEPGEEWSSEEDSPEGDSQMMYMTSMSWKDKDRTYRGFMDDEIVLSFGIEDKDSGGIDVVAGNLAGELQLCE